jgi:hypothetical protein
MHFIENIFLLRGKMAAVRPPFCAYTTEKEHQKHVLFSDKKNSIFVSYATTNTGLGLPWTVQTFFPNIAFLT